MFSQATSPLDCEQSLFFFRFSKGSARAHASVEVAKPRDARNEGGSPRRKREKKEKERLLASPVSRLQSRAGSFFACRGRFTRRTK